VSQSPEKTLGMRIGIDARKISDTGIGRYIESLVGGLLSVDPGNEYVLFMAPPDLDRYHYPAERVTKIPETAGKYSLREHWTLARKAAAARLDLFHAPHYTLPLFLKGPAVVTIHDIIHLLDPAVGGAARAYARWMIGSAVSRANITLTVSEHTKKNLVETLGAAPEKIIVVPNGGGSDFARPAEEEIDRALGALNLARGYFLFVGSDRPHKNLGAVAAVLGLMPPDTRFVVVGRVRARAKAAFAAFGDRVRFFDNVSKDTMAALYAGARALFFPSFHEGFGLPPLEAMACGAPVAASNRSAIPEVVGDAAALFDPRDARAMAGTLARIAEDESFCRELAARGGERVKLFSWEETARRTLACYQAAAR